MNNIIVEAVPSAISGKYHKRIKKPLLRLPVAMAALSLCLAAGCANQSADAQSYSEVPASSLQAAANDPAVKAFYEARGWQAVWNGDAAQDLREALAERARHGLDRATFLQSLPQEPAAREAALTRAALTYASALGRGLTDPEKLYERYTIPRAEPDLINGLASALDGGNLREWLSGLAPQDQEYQTLSDAYLDGRRRSEGAQSPAIANGPTIHQGDSDPRVPEIARALARAGYLAAPAASDSLIYDRRLAQAVRQLQQDRGIEADGIVGPATIKALNTGAADRARALAVALERRRWLQRAQPGTRIDVNTAAAFLEYYEEGKLVDRRKVIVGQPDWKTPQLGSTFYRLVANPDWVVPKSIERKELSDKGPAYFRANNMIRRDGFIVQLPGPDNALGLVKFDLDNPYAIYLHDTPAKTLFDRNLRQLSHGCIRVDDALGFAAMIAQHQGLMQEWQKARETGDETYVPLARKIPVRLLYHPTYIAPSGEVRFQQDTYGWNEPIARELGFEAGSVQARVPEAVDLGP